MSKSPDAFRTISEVADWLGIQAHVLRFWESKFTQVKPVKRAGGRRYYRPVDMLLLGGIKKLLHDDGLTIKGVQKIIREQGVEHVSKGSRPLDSPARDDLGAPGTLPKVVRLQSRVPPMPVAAPAPAPVSEPGADAAVDATPTGSDAGHDGDADADTGDGPEPEAVGAADSPPSRGVEASGDAAPAQPALPSFLHRPAAPDTPPDSAPDAAPDAAPDPTPDPMPDPMPQPKADSPPGPVPRQVEIADPPPEDEIACRPGPLGRLVRIQRLSANQAAGIAPVVADLRALFDRLSGHPPA